MRKLRWQILIAVIALGAVAILLFGNRGPIAILNEPASGGVYVEALIGQPSRFNPLLDYYNQVDRDVDRLIFSSMIRFDSRGNPIPDLAEKFGVSVTGDVFNVTLRENAVWHDGMPITTEDIVFTINLMKNPEIPLPQDLANLWNSVEVIAFDALNIQFRLPEPYAPFIDYLSFGILPKHLLDGLTPAEIINAPFNLAPVGSGPFKFKELRIEGGVIIGIVLDAFDDYYMGAPYLEQVYFKYYPSTMDALLAYQNGEVFGISEIQPNALDAVLAEPGLNVYTARMPDLSIVLFNLDNPEKPFFKDVIVRKALMIAINRPWIIDMALHGQGIIANGPIFPATWAYYDGGEKYGYDPNEAIRMLREAGYVIPTGGGTVRVKDGVPLFFNLLHPNTEEFANIARMIQGYWAAIGVGVNLIPVDYQVLMSDFLGPRQYEAALVTLSLMRTPDPDPYPFWHQAMVSAGQNYSQWDDRRASEYLEQARVTSNVGERIRFYRNFQLHFSRELPALPLFYPVYSYAVKADVLGVQLGPIFDPSDRFALIYIWSLEVRPQAEGTPVE